MKERNGVTSAEGELLIMHNHAQAPPLHDDNGDDDDDDDDGEDDEDDNNEVTNE